MIKNQFRVLLGISGLLAAGLAFAQGNTPIQPPPPPPVMQSGQALEPEVVIRQQGSETIYEYRVEGKLVMVKVQPAAGPPYYFVDRNGDGVLETRTSDPRHLPDINQWVLFRWR